jgi:precorrin-6B methylase 2
MADAAFERPRLAEIYDALDSDRSDLDVYAALAAEFGARTVLDFGCGTGTLACLLSSRGLDVTAVDPAAVSLDVARRKPGAGRVRWLRGDATCVDQHRPALQADFAVMTGNVAQVFLTEQEWGQTLSVLHRALRPGGRLVFESRNPARKAWLEWNRKQTYHRALTPAGPVETWIDLTSTELTSTGPTGTTATSTGPTGTTATSTEGGLVAFRTTFVFGADGATLTSDSVLRFRSREELARSVVASGLVVEEVRDAPDRPGREFVFVTRRPE